MPKDLASSGFLTAKKVFYKHLETYIQRRHEPYKDKLHKDCSTITWPTIFETTIYALHSRMLEDLRWRSFSAYFCFRLDGKEYTHEWYKLEIMMTWMINLFEFAMNLFYCMSVRALKKCPLECVYFFMEVYQCNLYLNRWQFNIRNNIQL